MRPSEIVNNIVTAFPTVPKLDTALSEPLYSIESDASAFKVLATDYCENTELVVTLKKYFGEGLEIETGTVTKEQPRFEFFK